MSGKCPMCNAPTDVTEQGWTRFDSSAYHMDAAKKLSEISTLKSQVEDLVLAIEEATKVLEAEVSHKEYDWIRKPEDKP